MKLSHDQGSAAPTEIERPKSEKEGNHSTTVMEGRHIRYIRKFHLFAILQDRNAVPIQLEALFY